MEAVESAPVITLTTDFGLSDHYVGAMKGVILSRCPNAHIVDISHQVPAFSIIAGAYTIDQAARWFPPLTTHIIVVDPGVGTSRRAIVAQANGSIFVAPDNGVLSLVFARDEHPRVHQISNRSLMLPVTSSTFHGRDVFAPVAASLASGAARVSDVGPKITDAQVISGLQPARNSDGSWSGVVLIVDHFGNVITNFPSSQFANIAVNEFVIQVPDADVSTFSQTFGSAPNGICFAYFGSSDYVELGLNQDSAARRLNVAPGDPVVLRLFDSQ